MQRETSPAEIDMMAQRIHEHPKDDDYPACFLDLPASTVLHLRKTAYVYLTGDFDFLGPYAPEST